MPVARPLFFADPKDAALRGEDTAFLLGGDVLVVPQLAEARDDRAVLPRGTWRIAPVAERRDDGTPDPDLPVLRVRPGAIVPLANAASRVDADSSATTTLLVALDPSRHASGILYEDDGDGFAYQRGAYRITRFTAEARGDRIRVRAETEGSWRPTGNRRPIEVRVLTAPGEPAIAAEPPTLQP
jgi:alpha-glucosidase